MTKLKIDRNTNTELSIMTECPPLRDKEAMLCSRWTHSFLILHTFWVIWNNENIRLNFEKTIVSTRCKFFWNKHMDFMIHRTKMYVCCYGSKSWAWLVLPTLHAHSTTGLNPKPDFAYCNTVPKLFENVLFMYLKLIVINIIIHCKDKSNEKALMKYKKNFMLTPIINQRRAYCMAQK
jgi:hypothetical protein